MPMRTPERLCAAGRGVTDEDLKITALTEYVELETWTPLMASLLVCGLRPIPGELEIPAATWGLDQSFYTGQEDAFPEARRVLELWNSREDVPLKVRPAVFVAWCKTKGINTDWLREIPEDVPVVGVPQALASSTVPVAPIAPKDPEEWVQKARCRAVEIIEAQRKRDLYPSQEALSDQIAEEFRVAGIVGIGGKPLTGSYLKRHALKGISSEQGKRLSTSTSQGK